MLPEGCAPPPETRNGWVSGKAFRVPISPSRRSRPIASPMRSLSRYVQPRRRARRPVDRRNASADRRPLRLEQRRMAAFEPLEEGSARRRGAGPIRSSSFPLRGEATAGPATLAGDEALRRADVRRGEGRRLNIAERLGDTSQYPRSTDRVGPRYAASGGTERAIAACRRVAPSDRH